MARWLSTYSLLFLGLIGPSLSWPQSPSAQQGVLAIMVSKGPLSSDSCISVSHPLTS